MTPERTLVYLGLLLLLAITLSPFLWMISTSVKSGTDIYAYPPKWIPRSPTGDHFRELFDRMNFSAHFLNSLIVSVGLTLLSLVFNSMAGFAFAKYQFPGREKLFTLLILTMMVPAQVSMIPVFLVLKELHLLNNYLGLIIPGSAGVFGIFLMRQFMMGIPDELLESARLDGCGELRIFRSLVLPLCKPALATLAIFTFMSTWNDFLWPLIVMTREAMYTLPVALANLSGQHDTEWGLLMAGAVVVTAPILLLFVSLQRFFVEGITMTGLKG